MNTYGKLVYFEFNRFIKLYLVLLVVTLVTQIAGVVITSNQYVSVAKKKMHEGVMSQATFVEEYEAMSMYRSEERRVGKECSMRCLNYQQEKRVANHIEL